MTCFGVAGHDTESRAWKPVFAIETSGTYWGSWKVRTGTVRSAGAAAGPRNDKIATNDAGSF
jgi:hypothetical protein